MPTRKINLTPEQKASILREQVRAGVEALERGEFTEVACSDLERYLEGLASDDRAR
jgi:hypothetical protein